MIAVFAGHSRPTDTPSVASFLFGAPICDALRPKSPYAGAGGDASPNSAACRRVLRCERAFTIAPASSGVSRGRLMMTTTMMTMVTSTQLMTGCHDKGCQCPTARTSLTVRSREPKRMSQRTSVHPVDN